MDQSRGWFSRKTQTGGNSRGAPQQRKEREPLGIRGATMDEETQMMLPMPEEQELEEDWDYDDAAEADAEEGGWEPRQRWRAAGFLLDFFLNPTLSFYAGMAAVNVVMERVKSLGRSRKMDRKAVDRFFDEEYLQRMEAKQARDRERWARGKKMGFILGLVFFVLLVLCLVMLGIYCHLHPRIPHVYVVTAKFNYLNMTDVDQAALIAQQAEGKGDYYAAIYNFSITYTLNFENRNNRVDFLTDFVEIMPYYYGFLMGHGRSPAFIQPRRTSRIIKITLVQPALEVPLRESYSIKRDIAVRTLTFMVDIRVKARMSTVFGLKSPTFWCSVRCDMQIVYGTITHNVCSNMNTVR